MSDTAPAPRDERSLLERALRPMADVRAGEGPDVLLMALTMFLLLGSYYMLKTVRESLILTQGGAAVKTYSSAGQALLLVVLVPAFAAFASRVNRPQLMRWVTLFFVANVLVFFALGRSGVALGIPFFLWVGIFNVMVVSQYWAFANDIYTPEEGKRLFALVGLGSTGGAWVGSLYAGRFIRALGPYSLMLVAAGVLALCVVLVQVVNSRQRSRGPKREAGADERPLGKEGAFELIFKDRYLMLIAVMFVVLNVVNTSGEYMLGKLVVADSVARFGAEAASLADRQKFVGGFYGQFFSYVNLLGFLLQMFGVSRIMKHAGVGGALFIHPAIALVGYVSVLRVPSLHVVGLAKLLDNAVDYSLGNTARHSLWLPTSREAKYKAKQAVDSFCMRAGDVLAAGVVFVGEHLAMAIPAFGAVNAALAGLWMLIVVRLGALNSRRVAEAGPAAA